MPQKIGWIKVHLSLYPSLRKYDQYLARDMYPLYLYLAQEAAYEDSANVKIGQLKISAHFLQKDFFVDWGVIKIILLMRHLEHAGYLTLTRLSNDIRDGYLVEICNYDQIAGEP